MTTFKDMTNFIVYATGYSSMNSWAARLISQEVAVINCDIHNVLPAIEALFPYLADHWCDYIRESSFSGPSAPVKTDLAR